MKALTITYQRVFSLPDYQNEKIGIELEVQEGEKATDALAKARQFVESQYRLKDQASLKKEYEAKRHIIEHPDDYTGREVKEAQKFIEEYEGDDSLPF